MQTFLPYEDFEKTASVLDPRRLGKQRVEALQAVKRDAPREPRLAHHPVVKMWRCHEAALVAYGLAITREWVRRGSNDSAAPSCSCTCTASRSERSGSSRRPGSCRLAG